MNHAKMVSCQVIEHVYEKVLNGGSEGGSGAATPTGEGRSHGEPGKKRHYKNNYNHPINKIFIIRRAGRGRERRGGAGGAAVQRHDAGPEHGPEDGQALHLEVRVGPGASLQTAQIETRQLHGIYSS